MQDIVTNYAMGEHAVVFLQLCFSYSITHCCQRKVKRNTVLLAAGS